VSIEGCRDAPEVVAAGPARDRPARARRVRGPYAGKLAEVAENDSAAFPPESAEATEVANLQRRFSEREVIPAVVVAERAGGS
jgi:hypothetical protein